MTVLLLIAAAHATPPGPILEGLAIAPRDDAPVDARILVHATFLPEAVVTDGPEVDEILPAAMEIAYSMGNDPVVALLPPEGGWAPDATRTVVVPGESYSGDAEGVSLTFSTRSTAAADPIEPEVAAVEVGDWSADDYYLWGCCLPTRTVTVTVRNPSDDPWSYVELLGDFPGPSQLTTEPVLSHLGAGIGPGEHAISFLQWKDGEVLQPLSFTVAAVEADGDRSDEVPVDLPGDGLGAVPCGCRSTGGGGWTLALALLAARRRQGR